MRSFGYWLKRQTAIEGPVWLLRRFQARTRIKWPRDLQNGSSAIPEACDRILEAMHRDKHNQWDWQELCNALGVAHQRYLMEKKVHPGY